MKDITMRTKPGKILKLFREAGAGDKVNLKVPWGYIFMAGGILSKIQDHKQYFAIDGKWVIEGGI